MWHNTSSWRLCIAPLHVVNHWRKSSNQSIADDRWSVQVPCAPVVQVWKVYWNPGIQSVFQHYLALSNSCPSSHRNTVGLINRLLFQHQRQLFLSFSPSSLLLPHYHSLTSLPWVLRLFQGFSTYQELRTFLPRSFHFLFVTFFSIWFDLY